MQRFLQILFTAAALALMIFTKGAILRSQTETGVYLRTPCSYFNPTVLGSGNFAPFVTAILACFLLILGFLALKSKGAQVGLAVLSPVTFVLSLLPLAKGCYSLLGACVSAALGIAAYFAIAAMFRKKAPAAAPPPPPPPPPPPRDPA